MGNFEERMKRTTQADGYASAWIVGIIVVIGLCWLALA